MASLDPLQTGSFVALGLAAILAVSAIAKLLDADGFAGILRSTYGVPALLVWPIAFAVPVLEAVTTALLLLDPMPTGLVLATILFASFAAAAGYAWSSGRSGPCGCFGVYVRSEVGVWTVIGSTSIALVALVALASMASFPRMFEGGVGNEVVVIATLALALTLWAARIAWRLAQTIHHR